MARSKKSKAQKHQSESESDSEGDTPVVEEKDVAVAASAQDDAASDSGSDSASSSDAGLSKAELKKKKKEQLRAAKAQKGKKGKKAKSEAAKQADDANEGEADGGSEPSGSEDDEKEGDDVVVTRQQPVQVLYCPICTFPAEMCEFSGMMEKCRPWLQEHAADLADAEERGRKRRILTDKERLEAMVEGRGVKKAIERVVVMELEKRTGKRMITSVFGMDLFGHNLKDLSKEWRKTFSCGAGVRAPEEGKHQECIDIQGNVVDQLAEMMVKKYSIPKTAIFTLEKKKKVPYY